MGESKKQVTTSFMLSEVARVCHEANKAYCITQGDISQPSWEEAPQWQVDSAIKGVRFHILNDNTTPADSHNSWLEEKTKEGWKYGEIKDSEKKEHPCFTAYENLPKSQQVKDYIFKGIVDAYKEAFKNKEDKETQKGLQPHEVRVVEERSELIDKITKLHAFMASDFYQTLDSTSQDYFEQQEVAMKEYSNILLYRINRFEGKMEHTVVPLTYGQQMVGLTFNPSGDDMVAKAKQLMAEAIDLVEKAHAERTNNGMAMASRESSIFRTNAVIEVVTAQMAIVKYLTWKH